MARAELVDGYLAAVGVERALPSLALLTTLTRRHVERFAFCSVGPRLGLALPLDVDSLFARIVVHRRGGYCFEHNGLFFEVLQELGFSVQLVLARVIHNQDTHPGLTHRITCCTIDDERYVVDVGFGALGPSDPVIVSPRELAEHDRVFRVVCGRPDDLKPLLLVDGRDPSMVDGAALEFHLQTRKDGQPWSLYRFEFVRYGQADCELGHFFSHKHPDAVFVNHLVASRILPDEIRSLRNRVCWFLRATGHQEVKVTSAPHLQTLLLDSSDVVITDDEAERLFGALP